MAGMSREDMIAKIQGGRSVRRNRKLILKVEDVPSEAELALETGDKTAMNAAADRLAVSIAQNQAQLSALRSSIAGNSLPAAAPRASTSQSLADAGVRVGADEGPQFGPSDVPTGFNDADDAAEAERLRLEAEAAGDKP